MRRSVIKLGWLVLPVLVSCDGQAAGLDSFESLQFSASSLEIGFSRRVEVTITNSGALALGPVDVFPGPVQDVGGGTIPNWSVESQPETIATLNPGDRRTVVLDVAMSGTLQAGRYTSRVRATAGESAVTEIELTFEVAASDGNVASLSIESENSTVRQGDVVDLTVVARDASGAVVEGVSADWSVDPPDAGFVDGSGRFVGYAPGKARLRAQAGGGVDEVDVTVSLRGLSGSLSVVGAGVEIDRFTSDLWVHGDHAYLGTWGNRSNGNTVELGNTLFTWDISNPLSPQLTSSLEINARTLNDVKVHPDGDLAIITHEGANDGKNGVTLVDLTDPAAPTQITRFTTGLEPGVHNAWLEGDYAYLVVDGVGSGLRILDVSEPSAPVVVSSFWAGESFLHDVYVRDGLAFLSHWSAGLVVLDVGNGISGGSPENPVEVSRLRELGGQTHNAWYWPEQGYAFLGEEDFGTPGIMRVVDLHDLEKPTVVATFEVPGQPPHNFWLDEASGTLYLAWYGQGIRALDVSGELLGDLTRQGREIEGMRYNGGSGSCGSTATCTWAPQFHDGQLYLSDRNWGLVVLQPGF